MGDDSFVPANHCSVLCSSQIFRAGCLLWFKLVYGSFCHANCTIKVIIQFIKATEDQSNFDKARILKHSYCCPNQNSVDLELNNSLKNYFLKYGKSLALAQENQVLVKRIIDIKFLLKPQSVKLGVWF